MAHINIEIKARTSNQDKIREILKSKNADFNGVDHQIDTYFKVNSGRLKIREGKIENYLIHYQRENKEGPKQSDVTLFKSNPESYLKEILTKPVEAGVDILIFSGYRLPVEQGLDEFLAAVKNKEVSESKLQTAVSRIIQLKQSLLK